jgi:hypothetical protein
MASTSKAFLENSFQVPEEVEGHTEVDSEVANRDGVAVKNATRIACLLDSVSARSRRRAVRLPLRG